MERLHIEKDKIGVIIGKGGATKNLIEWELGVKIRVSSSGAITIEGEALGEYCAVTVLQAISFGFSAEQALQLKNPDYLFETINIKNFAKSKNRIAEIKGRLIGKQGKVKRVIQDLGDVDLCITENRIGIIGEAGDVKFARDAIHSLLKGAKHSSVFKTLEHKEKYLREKPI